MPWDQIAFRTVRETLLHYFADRARALFELHVGDVALTTVWRLPDRWP